MPKKDEAEIYSLLSLISNTTGLHFFPLLLSATMENYGLTSIHLSPQVTTSLLKKCYDPRTFSVPNSDDFQSIGYHSIRTS